METINRYFYRCPDCLIVAALDSRPAPFAECDTCREPGRAAHMEFMGRVEQEKLVNEVERCPCDDRCTSARGPNCNCKCGAKNHGSNLWVTVRIVNDIPVVPAPKDAAKYRAQSDGFRGACASAVELMKQHYGGDWDRYQTKQWIDNRETWGAIYYDLKAVNKARKLREHNARMKAVNKVIEKLGGRAVAISIGAMAQAALF